VRKPALGAVLCGFIPFAGTCFSVSLWDRIEPRVLGLPFSFFWLISWLFLTPLCMWRAYRIEAKRHARSGAHAEDGGRA
jgi:uncharacterized protein DUF3311